MNEQTSPKAPLRLEIATLAGGCFWCTEAIFTEIKGVKSAVPGYSGGRVENPTYEQVCAGTTGHAEAVQVVFDPKIVAFKDILRVFLTTHDPTTLNRQGADVGTQYRSAIFTHNKMQEEAVRDVIAELTKKRIWDDKIVTQVEPFKVFYEAEEYHKDYFKRNPSQGYCRAVIAPKVAKFREKYRSMLR